MAFSSILIGSPLLALVLGSAFAIISRIPKNFIDKSIGTTFLQMAIIIIGLTITASNAFELTAKYFPYISIFVLLVLSAGALLAYFLKVDKKIGILIASGTAICGATAMAAIAPLIKAKPRDLLVSLAIIFIFNAIAIGIFPLIGSSIGMSYEQFGAWIAMAIHDTGSVMGAAMAFGGDTTEIAATLKLGRTLWLIPLILILGIFYKDRSNSKIKFPVFIFIFVLAIVVTFCWHFDNDLTVQASRRLCVGSWVRIVVFRCVQLLLLFHPHATRSRTRAAQTTEWRQKA